MRNSASLSVFNNFIGVPFCKVMAIELIFKSFSYRTFRKGLEKIVSPIFYKLNKITTNISLALERKYFFLNAEWLLNWIDSHLQGPQCKFQRSHFLSFVYTRSPFSHKDWLHRSWIQALIRQSAMRSLKLKNCVYQLLFNWMF